MSWHELISIGNWFHSLGATVWKARGCELCDLTEKCSEDLLLLLSLTNVMMSLRYDGPIPFTALNVNKYNLNSIRSRTLSQWRFFSLSWTESLFLIVVFNYHLLLLKYWTRIWSHERNDTKRWRAIVSSKHWTQVQKYTEIQNMFFNKFRRCWHLGQEIWVWKSWKKSYFLGLAELKI